MKESPRATADRVGAAGRDEKRMQLDFPESLDDAKRSILLGAATGLESEFGADLLGLVLSGSAGRGLDTAHSDLDLLVILEPDAAHGPRAPWLHTPELEQIPLSLDQLRTIAGFGDAQWGYRWSYAWAPTLVDFTGGRIVAAIERQTVLSDEEIMSVLVTHGRLDAWINLVYRALKSARDGCRREAVLDASEAIPAFLDVTFILNGLVRPYNKYLHWTLLNHPLIDWTTPDLLALVERMHDGDPEALRLSLRHVREVAEGYDQAHQQQVLGDIFDSWPAGQYPVLHAAPSSGRDPAP